MKRVQKNRSATRVEPIKSGAQSGRARGQGGDFGVVCASCWEPTEPRSRCALCGEDVRLQGPDGAYSLLSRLGGGGSAVTFRARRLRDGAFVCVKAMAHRHLPSFDAERLFAREVATLQGLKHSGIPRFLGHFSAGAGRHLAHYLIQEFIDGRDLEREFKARRPSQDDVFRTLDELLAIVEYLHSRAPQVIHRDIKPSNIMRARDGRLMLVDFGSVKSQVATTLHGGMTVAGTFGFMAPEQMRGDAEARSDLYSVGMVAATLLTGRQPGDLVDAQHRLKSRHLNLPPSLTEWLLAMTAIDVAERPRDARRARSLLAKALAAAAVQAEPKRARPAMASPRVERPVSPANAGRDGRHKRWWDGWKEPDDSASVLSLVAVLGGMLLWIWFGFVFRFGISSRTTGYEIALHWLPFLGFALLLPKLFEDTRAARYPSARGVIWLAGLATVAHLAAFVFDLGSGSRPSSVAGGISWLARIAEISFFAYVALTHIRRYRVFGLVMSVCAVSVLVAPWVVPTVYRECEPWITIVFGAAPFAFFLPVLFLPSLLEWCKPDTHFGDERESGEGPSLD